MRPDLKPPSDEALARLAAIVGEKNAITAPAGAEPYLVEERNLYRGRTPMVLRPASVDEVSAIMKLAHEERIAIVPQGGNTGLVGAQIPFEWGGEVVLSLGRMKAIREVDPAGYALTAEAGATLQSVQDAAAAADRLFPLSLGAEGTCQIGGNIASNAGGVHVLRYGNTRDLVLGIEAVLPGGEILHGLKNLRKDNTGYDLKCLFVGSEGTLGVITAATLKLFPRPAEVATVFAGLPSLRAAAELFSSASAKAGPLLTAFEVMPRIMFEFVLEHLPQNRDPLSGPHAWYVLFDISSPLGDVAERAAMAILEDAAERGVVSDAAVAASEAQALALWRIREAVVEAQKYEGGSIKHDVSVPISKIPAFIEEASAAVTALIAGSRPVAFGHFGDGNVHFNLTQPRGADKAAFLAHWDDVNAVVHGIVLRHGGSISAEHGIGRLKAHALETVKSEKELLLMRGIKAAFDPRGIMNPGKLLAEFAPVE
jgi:FAD/FMN-containing dehydrogenase